MIFATKAFTANDLVSFLVPQYSDDDSLRENQEKLFQKALPDVLVKWERNSRINLQRFLVYCSGQSYLPDKSMGFKITIAFEVRSVEGNSGAEDRLPEAHTCNHMLSVPETAYNGDAEVLERKLEQAVQYCEHFLMN